jgi:hypothetical protein
MHGDLVVSVEKAGLVLNGVSVAKVVSVYALNELTYLAFAAAFFLRSAQRFFINSESLLRPAALSRLAGFAGFAGFALTALLLGLLLVRCGAGLLKLDPLRMLRAEVSLAISASISCTILAVSTSVVPSTRMTSVIRCLFFQSLS